MKIIIVFFVVAGILVSKSEGMPTGAIPSLVYRPRVVIRIKPSASGYSDSLA